MNNVCWLEVESVVCNHLIHVIANKFPGFWLFYVQLSDDFKLKFHKVAQYFYLRIVKMTSSTVTVAEEFMYSTNNLMWSGLSVCRLSSQPPEPEQNKWKTVSI